MCANSDDIRPGSAVGALTTGQAAKLCNVKADTILKWIKSGKLDAVRTVGGHCRIDPAAISRFVRTTHSGSAQPAGTHTAASRPLYCWEYLSEPGLVHESCQQCIVYQSHSAWCFRLKSADGDRRHAKLFCSNACDDCAYYRRIAGLPTHILLVTTDEQIIKRFAGQCESGVLLHIAHNGYEASAAISHHHPSFAVLDQDSLRSETDALLECISRDTRVPGLKVILSTCRPLMRPGSVLPGNVVRVIRKPFGIEDIVDVIESFPVERVTVQE